MTDTENLVPEHLKRYQAGQEHLARGLSGLTRRIGNLEAGQATIVQFLGTLAAADAQQQIAVDGVDMRLERIERRLALIE